MATEVENESVKHVAGKNEGGVNNENAVDAFRSELDAYSQVGNKSVEARMSGAATAAGAGFIGKGAEEMSKLPRLEFEGAGKMLEGAAHLLKDINKLRTHKDGVESLGTGDHIVRDNGKQTLFTSNGDSITINPDGSHSVKGDVKKMTTNKAGETTVEFADGGRVSLDRKGFLSVERNGMGIGFARAVDLPFLNPKFPPICIDPVPMDFEKGVAAPHVQPGIHWDRKR